MLAVRRNQIPHIRPTATQSNSPDAAAADVSKAVQCSPAWISIVLSQTQLLLNLINYTPAACVDAHVLERQLEVWDVGPQTLLA